MPTTDQITSWNKAVPGRNVDANETHVIEHRPTPTTNQITRNVIVFGATGAGKSSVINMICGNSVAMTSSNATGCTFTSTPYDVQMPDGSRITYWDTAGLDEGERGTVTAKDAIVNLYRLIRMLDDGVCLLIYCMRGPRINESLVRNYKMFYSAFCLEKVPIVLVVTGLEEEPVLDDWWSRNEALFQRYHMMFAGHACVTATRGKEKETKGTYVYEREYELSVVAVQELVKGHYLHEPWKMETMRWLVEVLKILCSSRMMLFDISPTVLRTALVQALKEFGGSAKDASQIVTEVQADRQRGFFFFLFGRRRWSQARQTQPQQIRPPNTETPLPPPPPPKDHLGGRAEDRRETQGRPRRLQSPRNATQSRVSGPSREQHGQGSMILEENGPNLTQSYHSGTM